MPKSSSAKVERTNTGQRGARKTHLSRLELFLLGKGPTTTVQRRLVKEANKGKVGK